MMSTNNEVRDHPLVHTSSKSNLAHQEINAGITGLMKCVILACYGVAMPNVHLRFLNPHIDMSGYPAVFVADLIGQGNVAGYFGVSSFGFAGSNARADIWGRVQAGYLKPDHGEMFSFGADRFGSKCILPGAGEYEVDVEEAADLGGVYWINNPCDQFLICIKGTWNSWATSDMMVRNENGVYQWAFKLGDTKVEEFRLNCEHDEHMTIF